MSTTYDGTAVPNLETFPPMIAEKGMAVLVVSSEPDELPDLCDRVLVMAEGRVVRELTGDAVSRSAIVEASYAEPHHSERLAT